MQRLRECHIDVDTNNIQFKDNDFVGDDAACQEYLQRCGYNVDEDLILRPRYTHDCAECTWMRFDAINGQKFEFYHRHHDSLLARCGNEPHEYASCALRVMEARDNPWMGLPELWWAYIRYLQDFQP